VSKQDQQSPFRQRTAAQIVRIWKETSKRKE